MTRGGPSRSREANTGNLRSQSAGLRNAALTLTRRKAKEGFDDAMRVYEDLSASRRLAFGDGLVARHYSGVEKIVEADLRSCTEQERTTFEWYAVPLFAARNSATLGNWKRSSWWHARVVKCCIREDVEEGFNTSRLMEDACIAEPFCNEDSLTCKRTKTGLNWRLEMVTVLRFRNRRSETLHVRSQ